MNRFHVCKKVKSFLLVALSVAILVCSVPSFSIKSYALEGFASGYLANLLLSEYLGLNTYLLSRGYSAPTIATGEGDLLVDGSNSVYAQAEECLTSFYNSIRALNYPMYVAIQQAFENYATSGKLVLTQEQEDFLDSYFASLTVDSSVVVGQSNTKFEPYDANTPYMFSYDYINKSTGIITQVVDTYIPNFDYLPVVSYGFDSDGILYTASIYFLAVDDSASQTITRSTTVDNAPFFLNMSSQSRPGYGTVKSSVYFATTSTLNSYGFSNLGPSSALIGVSLTWIAIDAILSYLRQYGYYQNTTNYQSTQVVDTSDQEILSSSSVVDAVTGAISGGLTVFVPNVNSLIQTLNDFYNGVITWAEAIKSLGLSSVSSTATVDEKEEALSNVAYPDSTYDWLTSTGWGSNTITGTVTDELANTQVQEGSIAEELAEQYSDNAPEEPSEEDKNKGGLAMLIATALLYLGLWNDPDTDPTNPDSGGIVGDPDDEETVPWLVDTLTAIPVASGILGDVFDAAGGNNGFGFIYTVGISFVLFSVIIGAGHFFGALGSEIQARSQENDIKADHEYNKQQAYKAYREGLISKRELYRMTRK